MATHRYAIGEHVYVSQRRLPSAKTAGVYRIVRHLPAQDGGGDQQYRIKSEAERHERVVAEGELSAAPQVLGGATELFRAQTGSGIGSGK